MLPSKTLGTASAFNFQFFLGRRMTFPSMIISSFLMISFSKKWFSQTLDDAFNFVPCFYGSFCAHCLSSTSSIGVLKNLALV
jgi:hypothetical protein